MRQEFTAREWSAKQKFSCLAGMIFLTAFAWLQWPSMRPQASMRPVGFREWAAREDARAQSSLRPLTPEQYSDVLTAVGEAPAVPSSPCAAETGNQNDDENDAFEGNFLALGAGEVETAFP